MKFFLMAAFLVWVTIGLWGLEVFREDTVFIWALAAIVWAGSGAGLIGTVGHILATKPWKRGPADSEGHGRRGA